MSFNISCNTSRRCRIAACAAVLLSMDVLSMNAAAIAHGFTVGSLEIGHPWMRATPAGAKVAGGYLTVTNVGSEPDRLIEATSPVAGHVGVHEMKMDGEVMQMRELPGGLEIKPGQKVELAPGGYHLMFTDLHAPIKEGAMVKGQLRFEKAGVVDVEYKVESVGYPGPRPHMQMPMHEHGH